MTEIPSTVSRSDTDESATRSSSNSSTATNISCAKDTSFQFQSVPSNEVQAISQVAPSTSGIDSMVTTRLDSSASNRLRAVTPDRRMPFLNSTNSDNLFLPYILPPELGRD